jgi:siroheme synthase
MSKTGPGKVYLVGAGPGDPKLLTLRAVEVLRESEVVLVDRLVNGDVLAYPTRP